MNHPSKITCSLHDNIWIADSDFRDTTYLVSLEKIDFFVLSYLSTAYIKKELFTAAGYVFKSRPSVISLWKFPAEANLFFICFFRVHTPFLARSSRMEMQEQHTENERKLDVW